MDPELLAVLRQVIDALETHGIAYVIGGSLASSVLGVPRSTNGADIVADVRPQHVDALVAALETDFYADPAMIRDAIDHTTSFNLVHYETAHKVDVFVCGDDAFRRAQIARATALGTPAALLPFLSPEDAIVAKLLWYRAGGEVSERQWRDVLEVIAAQSAVLDGAYLLTTATGLGVADLLKRAIAEA